jgi:hypothetical protein
MNRFSLAIVIVASLAVVAQADSLTTLYDYNNTTWNNGVLFFDAEVTNPNGLTITGFDCNVAADAGFDVFMSVLTTAGTYVGNTQNPGAWTPRGISPAGLTAGLNNPSYLDTPDFDLAPGAYGIMLILYHEDPNSADGHAFTDGPLGPYSNADLTLTLGASANFPFGPPSSPSVWNGTVYYSEVPEPSSLLLLGVGALALIRRR